MGWSESELVSDCRAGARRQRATDRTVYSVLVPLANGDDPVQDELSEVIHKVEKDGWVLDQVNTLPAASPSTPPQALLIFRINGR